MNFFKGVPDEEERMKQNDFVEDASDVDARIQAKKALEGKMICLLTYIK